MARRCSHNCEFSRLGVFVACAAHLPHLNPNPESHERDLCISWVDRALFRQRFNYQSCAHTGTSCPLSLPRKAWSHFCQSGCSSTWRRERGTRAQR
jgi:hypothetical protein